MDDSANGDRLREQDNYHELHDSSSSESSAWIQL